MKISWMIYLSSFLKLAKPLQSLLELLTGSQFYFPLITNSTNSTNNDTRYYNDDDDDDDDDCKFVCINDQKKFIWSSSALYLLGPKPLFWLTLFAVHVRESSITVNLPCLCSDVYDDLLSRLTYLVSVHKLLNLFI